MSFRVKAGDKVIVETPGGGGYGKARVWDSSARSFPTASLWREKAALSPFQRSLLSLPPLLGLRPTTKGAIPLGTSAALLPQISKLASVEKPCPLSRPRTFLPIPFALGNRRDPCPLRPQAFFRNGNLIQAPPNSLGGVGEVNKIQSESWRRFGTGLSSTTPRRPWPNRRPYSSPS